MARAEPNEAPVAIRGLGPELALSTGVARHAPLVVRLLAALPFLACNAPEEPEPCVRVVAAFPTQHVCGASDDGLVFRVDHHGGELVRVNADGSLDSIATYPGASRSCAFARSANGEHTWLTAVFDDEVALLRIDDQGAVQRVIAANLEIERPEVLDLVVDERGRVLVHFAARNEHGWWTGQVVVHSYDPGGELTWAQTVPESLDDYQYGDLCGMSEFVPTGEGFAAITHWCGIDSASLELTGMWPNGDVRWTDDMGCTGIGCLDPGLRTSAALEGDFFVARRRQALESPPPPWGSGERLEGALAAVERRGPRGQTHWVTETEWPEIDIVSTTPAVQNDAGVFQVAWSNTDGGPPMMDILRFDNEGAPMCRENLLDLFLWDARSLHRIDEETLLMVGSIQRPSDPPQPLDYLVVLAPADLE